MRNLKKTLSIILVVCVIVACMAVPAFAREEATQSINFPNLTAGSSKSATQTVYIRPTDTFVVESLSWSPMGNDVRVEFVPVGGGAILGWTYQGGSISYAYLSMSPLTAGDYTVRVRNVSQSTVTGNLNYSWQ